MEVNRMHDNNIKEHRVNSDRTFKHIQENKQVNAQEYFQERAIKEIKEFKIEENRKEFINNKEQD